MTVRDRFRELAAGAAIAALEPAESREFETLLAAATPEERRLLAELEFTALCLSAATSPIVPPAELRAQLRSRLRSRLGPSRWARLAATLGLDRPLRALAAVAGLAALTAGTAFLTARYRERSGRAEGRIAELGGEVERLERLLEVVRDPQVEIVQLRGARADSKVSGKVIWGGASGSGLLQLSNLPPSPAGKVYQLWVFPRDHEPWSAAVFEADAAMTDLFFRIDDFAPGPRESLRALGVALEDPGAEKPGRNWLCGAQFEPKPEADPE